MSKSSFGRYRLLALLGQGGMGKVYRAHDSATDRVVALKVLRADAAEDAEFQQRFRREAHIAASLNDPHVIPIHNYGEIDGHLYLDMRLIEGRDLGQTLKESDQPLAPALAVRYVEQVAEALNAAHSVGLVHRDVKPSNILITPRDFVYLIDFGIAQAADATRLTSTGLAIGTFAYMAPERLRAEKKIDSAADIYSLTCVLYECLTGAPPFRGDGVEQQIAAHLMTAPPRPSVTNTEVSQSFDAVIEKGLSKDPSERYQSALELATAARAAADAADRDARPKAPRTKKPSGFEKSPKVSPPISTSAQTLLAPTRPANVAVNGRVSGDEAAQQGGAYWLVLWLVLVAVAALLVVVILGIR